MSDRKNDKVVRGETCYTVHAKSRACCARTHCRYWFSNPSHYNCVMLAANDGPRTLEDVGKLYNLTRMRICQIESGIKKKLTVIS